LVIYSGNEPIPHVSNPSLISTRTGPPECVDIFTGLCALQSSVPAPVPDPVLDPDPDPDPDPSL